MLNLSNLFSLIDVIDLIGMYLVLSKVVAVYYLEFVRIFFHYLLPKKKMYKYSQEQHYYTQNSVKVNIDYNILFSFSKPFTLEMFLRRRRHFIYMQTHACKNAEVNTASLTSTLAPGR